MFKDYFHLVVPSALAKRIYETKNKNKNNESVELIKVRWSNSKDVIEKMSEDEIKTEKTDKILKLLKKFLILIKEFEKNKVQV